MPSRVVHRGIIISPKNNKKRNTYVLIRRTGYANVWIDDKHIYWNYTTKYNNPQGLDFNELVQQQAQQTPRKGVIVVRRK